MDTTTKVSPTPDAEYEEYLAATQTVGFVKISKPALEARMMDPAIPYGQRFLAWLELRSWGNYRLYAVLESKKPATQADAARELAIDKRIISHAVRFLEQRGYLYRRGKSLYPTIAPKVVPLPEKVADSPDVFTNLRESPEFTEFFEAWKVANSSDFSEWEAAREAKKVATATDKHFQKVVLSAYKESRTLRTNGAASLYEIKKTFKTENPPPPQPSVSLAPPDQPKAEEEDGLYQKFKEAYPKDHFDEPKAKPAFRKLGRSERQRAVARLLFPFLTCPRWLDEGGRWIPLASNFLRDEYFDAEPPPPLKRQNGGKQLAPIEEVLESMRRDREGRT